MNKITSMNKLVARTRGKGVDYSWKTMGVDEGDLSFKTLSGLLDNQRPSVAVECSGDNWNVILSGIQSGISDSSGTWIYVTAGCLGVTEEQARAIAISALTGWESLKNKVTSCFSWQGESWGLDWEALDGYFSEWMLGAVQSKWVFSDRWERGVSQKDRRKLCDELMDHSFASGSGIRLIWTGIPTNEAYERIRAEADRLHWDTDSREVDLGPRKAEKKTKLPSTLSKKSPTPSNESQKTYLSVFSEICRYLEQGWKAFSETCGRLLPKSWQNGPLSDWKKLILVIAMVLIPFLILLRGCERSGKDKDSPYQKTTSHKE